MIIRGKKKNILLYTKNKPQIKALIYKNADSMLRLLFF